MSEPISPPAPRSGVGLVACGVVLALAALPVNFALLDVPVLRSTGLAAFACLALAVALTGTGAARDRRVLVRLAAVFPLAVLGLWSGLFFVKLKLPDAPAAQSAKQVLDFTLPDQTGKPVQLAAARARGPVLLVFFRGHW